MPKMPPAVPFAAATAPPAIAPRAPFGCGPTFLGLLGPSLVRAGQECGNRSKLVSVRSSLVSGSRPTVCKQEAASLDWRGEGSAWRRARRHPRQPEAGGRSVRAFDDVANERRGYVSTIATISIDLGSTMTI
jgi:hypothetical protein